MKLVTSEVSVDVVVDGKKTTKVIDTVDVRQYETWAEIPPEEYARVLKDSNRQRIEDARNKARAAYKAAQEAGPKKLKTLERDALLARLGRGEDVVAELVKVQQELAGM